MHRLIGELEAVKDPRTGNSKKHKLGDILFIAIAAGGTKSLARMRKQAAWNTGVLDEIPFSAFGAKKRNRGKSIRNPVIEMRLP